MADRVSDPRGTEPDAEMSAIGYGIAALNLLILLSLLPFIAIIVLYNAITGASAVGSPPDRPRSPTAGSDHHGVVRLETPATIQVP